MTKGRETFSEWVRNRREELDMTEHELAKETGLSFDTILLVEAGGQVTREIRQVIEAVLGPWRKPREKRKIEARGAGTLTDSDVEKTFRTSPAPSLLPAVDACPECGYPGEWQEYGRCRRCGRHTV